MYRLGYNQIKLKRTMKWNIIINDSLQYAMNNRIAKEQK